MDKSHYEKTEPFTTFHCFLRLLVTIYVLFELSLLFRKNVNNALAMT